MWLQRIDTKIAAVRQRDAERARGEERRPPAPDWIIELGIGCRNPPVQVHAGDCYAAAKRRRAVDRDEARRLLAAGLPACTHCRPDRHLGILE
ncbi:DUF6233 domain-containing protein [Streptomyces sp. TRM68416]|uniref:DUF6233 domain-containing protein n=1 Tax=Streptomyces sp. TRM68416 TaxID=2758412 RepID=UPI001661AE8F|nr:DUF6233 domain-containing protein [Streptomyces sp. TRM68416]MBD0844743.1 hypothetical protein [Streptomyces sp. TRM68416]